MKKRKEMFSRRKCLSIANISSILFFMLSVQYIVGQQWIDDSFEDFSKGYFDDSGQNIYVSRKGEIRTIRKFDLNNDEYIDLIFNSTHDDDVGVPASIATVVDSEKRVIQTDEITIRGSLSSEVRDLNGDGFLDIVFCPNPPGIQNQRRFVCIAYGDKEGWSESRINGVLPVNRVKELAVADINSDGWPDILTLNSTAWLPNQPEGNILKIFWGSDHGFILTNYKDVGVGQATNIVSGDFDQDGVEDVALLNKDHVQVIWGDEKLFEGDNFTSAKVEYPNINPKCMASGDIDNNGCTDILVAGAGVIGLITGSNDRVLDFRTLVSGVSSTSVSVADIDGDSHKDLITSDFNLQRALGGEMLGGSDLADKEVTIFWGCNGQFSKLNSTSLNAPYTVSTAVADLDGDGKNDIICATHQDETRFTTESKIFWGDGKRQFRESEQGITSHGAYHVAVIPALTDEGLPYVVVSNAKFGSLREEVPLIIYYGSAEGFDEANVTKIPFRSGYEASAVDLNEDGYVDLLAVNSMHGGGADDPTRGLNIFWGTDTGLDLSNRTILNEINISTTNVADLNKDGYLDIVLGAFDRYDKKPTHVIIYYGSENGYSIQDRVEILSEGRSTSPNIADYNNDGWLDIAVSSYSKDRVRVFYGGPDGFDEDNQKNILIPSIIDLETADLNNDGYLDIVASSYKDKVNDFHDTGVTIFWGGNEGFKEWNAQWLEANTALGPMVADIDDDGFLDLFLPSYHGDNTRENLPSYIYWGSPTGFSFKNRSKLIVNSASDAFASDFDNDGLLDIVVVEHATNWRQSITNSSIFYNDGERFTSNNVKVEKLPAPGPHWMWGYDVGNIINRKYESSYYSSVKNWDYPAVKGTIDVEAELSRESKLSLFIRSANDEPSLENKDWRQVDEDSYRLDKSDRCFQYKLVLQSCNGNEYPVVKKVSSKISK
ncbi:MAG: VCBS repeat-containing protein [Bacteroidota bacterium]|jgi:hypothetical protein|nr:VCBS repeat-containing protein [Bacteroidota bacterium]